MEKEITAKTEKKQRSLANLKPFKKGQSGNPKGKPKGTISITQEIKKKLLTCPKGKEKNYLEYMVDMILQKAIIEGDETMLKLIWNYTDGMPKQTIGGDGDNPIKIEFVEIKRNAEGKSFKG